MKKTVSLIIALIIVALCCVSAVAEPNYGGLNEFNKSSRSDFVGKGTLTKTVQVLETFDDKDFDNYNFNINSEIDTSNKKEGKASLNFQSSEGSVGDYKDKLTLSNQKVFETLPNQTKFSVNVTDVQAQTIGMWFYIEDVDKLPCDHDFAYDHLQEKCATIYFRFGVHDSNYQQWNHTFYGNGWHYIEFDFATDENSPQSLLPNREIVYQDMKYMTLMIQTGGMPVNVNIDEISLITYKSTAKKEECPDNGRWISTFDYDQLDGATVTEWMGAYFDTEDKTQGSSSLALRGRKEHVDYREVLAGYNDFIIDVNNECLCMDIYCENTALIGTGLSISFYRPDGKGMYLKYSTLVTKVVSNGGVFKNGWNTVHCPIKHLSKDKEAIGDTFDLWKIKIFCEGSSKTDFYTLKFDNMYIAKTSDVSQHTFSDEEQNGGETNELGPKKDETEEKDMGFIGDIAKTLGLKEGEEWLVWVIFGVVVLIIAAIAVVIIVLAKKKKPAAPDEKTPKENPENKTE